MKIGIDASRAYGKQKTGTERYSFEMINHLLELESSKKHIWYIYIRNGEVDQSIARMAHVKIVNIETKWLWTQLGLAIRTWMDNLDVLWVPAHTLPLFRNPRTKTLVTIHGLEYEWLPEYNNWIQRWYLPLSTLYAAISSTKILAVSKFTARKLVELFKINASKIKVVYEGAETRSKKAAVGSGEKKRILDKYGLIEGKYIAFLGTIQPRKNLARLVEAFSQLSFENPSLKLVIIGKWGWMYEDVKTAIKETGMESKVIITGYVDDTERYVLIANALFYIQPSITEGFGLPVVEAMKMGVPVLVSDGGALPELVDDRFEKFDPLDGRDMYKKMERMVKDSGYRNSIGEYGKVLSANFDWRKSAGETYNILVSLNGK